MPIITKLHPSLSLQLKRFRNLAPPPNSQSPPLSTVPHPFPLHHLINPPSSQESPSPDPLPDSKPPDVPFQDRDFGAEEARAGSRMQRLHGRYINKLCEKIKKGEKELGRPATYVQSRSLWIHPPDNCFLASNLSNPPSVIDLMRPRVLLVLPDYLMRIADPGSDLKCPHVGCGGKLNSRSERCG
ncbi:hypothetical protein T439DRAFT_105783 [Meredithblackwellia eburnea MCA 4105]